jgi:hypothetical protein
MNPFTRPMIVLAVRFTLRIPAAAAPDDGEEAAGTELFIFEARP